MGTKTVLVVEDERLVRELICETLRAKGYRVIEAQSVQGGLEYASETQEIIHLLLTDVVMPGMNGRDLEQAVSVFHPNIQVLFISGYTENVIANHGILKDGVNFLQKPFTLQSLTLKVRQVLG